MGELIVVAVSASSSTMSSVPALPVDSLHTFGPELSALLPLVSSPALPSAEFFFRRRPPVLVTSSIKLPLRCELSLRGIGGRPTGGGGPKGPLDPPGARVSVGNATGTRVPGGASAERHGAAPLTCASNAFDGGIAERLLANAPFATVFERPSSRRCCFAGSGEAGSGAEARRSEGISIVSAVRQ